MKIAFEVNWRTVLRWVLAVVLVWAALSKIANLNEFYLSIRLYQVPLPDALVRLAAMVMPWLELLCGILMVAGTARRAALIWAAILFVVFIVATGQAWARGLNISCGCFKLDFIGNDALAKFLESVKFAFLRALLLLACTIYVWRETDDRPTPTG